MISDFPPSDNSTPHRPSHCIGCGGGGETEGGGVLPSGGLSIGGGGGLFSMSLPSNMQHWHPLESTPLSHPIYPSITGKPPARKQAVFLVPGTQKPTPTPRLGTYFPHLCAEHTPGGCGGIPNGGGGELVGGGSIGGAEPEGEFGEGGGDLLPPLPPLPP